MAIVREWVFDVAWVWANIRRHGDRLGGIANVSFMSRITKGGRRVSLAGSNKGLISRESA